MLLTKKIIDTILIIIIGLLGILLILRSFNEFYNMCINNNNDIELTKTIDNLYNSYKNVNNPYRIYFDNYKMHRQLLDTVVDCSNILVDGPVKYIYFVIRHNNRINRDINITQTNLPILLNENNKTYQNDIFNYSNIITGYWGTYDTFKNLTV